MKKAYFYVNKGYKTNTSSSHPISFIGEGLKKHSPYFDIFYGAKILSDEDIREIEQKAFVFISYQGNQIQQLEGKVKAVNFITTVEECSKKYYKNTSVPSINMSRYSANWYKKVYGRDGELLRIGGDTEIFPYKEKVAKRKPKFGMVYNMGVAHRKGTGIIVELIKKGINIVAAVGDITGKSAFSHDRLYNYYQGIDCLIINAPDNKGRETGSACGIEAGSCGTTVITTPVGLGEEAIENGKTGFIIKNNQEIIDICTRYEDNEELIVMGKKYSEHIRKECSWKNRIKDWDNFVLEYKE